jgi:hypothetical protein
MPQGNRLQHFSNSISLESSFVPGFSPFVPGLRISIPFVRVRGQFRTRSQHLAAPAGPDAAQPRPSPRLRRVRAGWRGLTSRRVSPRICGLRPRQVIENHREYESQSAPPPEIILNLRLSRIYPAIFSAKTRKKLPFSVKMHQFSPEFRVPPRAAFFSPECRSVRKTCSSNVIFPISALWPPPRKWASLKP